MVRISFYLSVGLLAEFIRCPLRLQAWLLIIARVFGRTLAALGRRAKQKAMDSVT